MNKLVLASKSPRRTEILKMLGYSFDVRPSDCDETVTDVKDPEEYVRILSRRKALAVKKEKGEVVLGSDTVVYLDGKILGKPKDEADAYKMLSFLSGKTHKVCTGVTLTSEEKTVTKSDVTKVTFKNLSDEDILSYIKSGEPFGKAGAYAIQGKGGVLVEKTEGDYYTIVGLPEKLTLSLLKEFDVEK